MSQPTQDPRSQHPKPPFPQTPQAAPGSEAEMSPKADHGEQSYVGSGKLANRVAVVTGGDSGIGKAVALAFAREGADVVICHLPEEQADADDTVKWVEQAGRVGISMPGDLGDEAHCKHVVDATVQRFGKIDVLVNNAAFQMARETMDEVPAGEFEKTYRTNVFAMFYLCRHAAKYMVAGSSVINVSSIQAYQPSPNLLAYASTKGAIVNFTKGLSALLADKGIRVNSVAPGPVWTPLIPSTMGAKAAALFGKGNPTERPAQPAELAPAFVYLASQDASYVNAAVIPVTGGKPTM